MSRIFNQLLNVKGTVVEDARIADSPLRPEPVLEIRVRPRAGMLRCSRCGERWHGYDQGGGRAVGVARISAAGASNWSPP